MQRRQNNNWFDMQARVKIMSNECVRRTLCFYVRQRTVWIDNNEFHESYEAPFDALYVSKNEFLATPLTAG